MLKLLFFAESVSLAHIGRPFRLAEWAKELGFQVHIATGAKGIQILESIDSDLHCSEIYSISGESFYQRVNQGKFFYTSAELETYVAADIQVIQKELNLVKKKLFLRLLVMHRKNQNKLFQKAYKKRNHHEK